MLGVRYYMAWTPEAQAKADAQPRPRGSSRRSPTSTAPTRRAGRSTRSRAPISCKGSTYEPVVAADARGHDVRVLRQPRRRPTARAIPSSARGSARRRGWFTNDDAARHGRGPQSGPDEWQRVDVDDLADRTARRALDPVEVTDIDEDADKISFHVDEVGVPVVVKASYFPNWEVHGAEGPYRLAPNLMVVVPTENDVTLTYGLTAVDWLGRVITLVGLVGLVVLVALEGRAPVRRARDRGRRRARPATATDDDDADDTGDAAR